MKKMDNVCLVVLDVNNVLQRLFVPLVQFLREVTIMEHANVHPLTLFRKILADFSVLDARLHALNAKVLLITVQIVPKDLS